DVGRAVEIGELRVLHGRDVTWHARGFTHGKYNVVEALQSQEYRAPGAGEACNRHLVRSAQRDSRGCWFPACSSRAPPTPACCSSSTAPPSRGARATSPRVTRVRACA